MVSSARRNGRVRPIPHSPSVEGHLRVVSLWNQAERSAGAPGSGLRHRRICPTRFSVAGGVISRVRRSRAVPAVATAIWVCQNARVRTPQAHSSAYLALVAIGSEDDTDQADVTAESPGQGGVWRRRIVDRLSVGSRTDLGTVDARSNWSQAPDPIRTDTSPGHQSSVNSLHWATCCSSTPIEAIAESLMCGIESAQTVRRECVGVDIRPNTHLTVAIDLVTHQGPQLTTPCRFDGPTASSDHPGKVAHRI